MNEVSPFSFGANAPGSRPSRSSATRFGGPVCARMKVREKYRAVDRRIDYATKTNGTVRITNFLLLALIQFFNLIHRMWVAAQHELRSMTARGGRERQRKRSMHTTMGSGQSRQSQARRRSGATRSAGQGARGDEQGGRGPATMKAGSMRYIRVEGESITVKGQVR